MMAGSAQRKDDHAGLGDWYVNQQKFPNGLKPLIDHVHALGMDFGLWVEPEMVNPDSDLYRKHPDWAMQFPNRQHTEQRNQLVLNLANPEVAAIRLPVPRPTADRQQHRVLEMGLQPQLVGTRLDDRAGHFAHCS